MNIIVDELPKTAIDCSFAKYNDLTCKYNCMFKSGMYPRCNLECGVECNYLKESEKQPEIEAPIAIKDIYILHYVNEVAKLYIILGCFVSKESATAYRDECIQNEATETLKVLRDSGDEKTDISQVKKCVTHFYEIVHSRIDSQ